MRYGWAWTGNKRAWRAANQPTERPVTCRFERPARNARYHPDCRYEATPTEFIATARTVRAVAMNSTTKEGVRVKAPAHIPWQKRQRWRFKENP